MARENPINLDEKRAEAFEQFEQGVEPIVAARNIGVHWATVKRWKAEHTVERRTARKNGTNGASNGTNGASDAHAAEIAALQSENMQLRRRVAKLLDLLLAE